MSEDFTPGPWRVRVNPRHDPENCDLSICGDIWVLADINGPQYAHQEPNAYLMALAPEMFAMLHQYRNDMLYPPAPDSVERRLAAIDALIAKASPTEFGNIGADGVQS